MTLLEFFGTIPDHRKKNGKIFQLEYILLFSLLAVLSGATGYASIADWINAKESTLRKVFEIKWIRFPKKSGLQKIFVALDKNELEKMFRAYMLQEAGFNSLSSTNSNSNSNSKTKTKTKTKSTPNNNLQIAIDGKTLRGSHNNIEDVSAINLISIFLVEKQLILGHVEVQNKESEMTGVRDNILSDESLVSNLKSLGIKILTVDALHCQKKL